MFGFVKINNFYHGKTLQKFNKINTVKLSYFGNYQKNEIKNNLHKLF